MAAYQASRNVPLLIAILLTQSWAAEASCPTPERGPASGAEKLNCDVIRLNIPVNTRALKPGEAWLGGTAETERDQIAKDSCEIMNAQAQLGPHRVFHNKQDGCLVGQLEILDPPASGPAVGAFQGMFDVSKTHIKTYTVLARYSNGVGKIQPDYVPDVRGFAIKIFGVKDEKTGKPKTVDFTMTNSPTPFGRTSPDFIDFMKGLLDPLKFPEFVLHHPEAAARLAAASSLFTPTLTQAQFWAGHAYWNETESMKLNVTPLHPDPRLKPSHLPTLAELKHAVKALVGPGHRLDNYLSTDLATHAAYGPIEYSLNLQRQNSVPEEGPDGKPIFVDGKPVLVPDEKATPIEDNLHEWMEDDARSVQVARLVFPPQAEADHELQHLCRKYAFTPAHNVSQHEPLSEMGRARAGEPTQDGQPGSGGLYGVSSKGRGAFQTEIDEAQVQAVAARVESPDALAAAKKRLQSQKQ